MSARKRARLEEEETPSPSKASTSAPPPIIHLSDTYTPSRRGRGASTRGLRRTTTPGAGRSRGGSRLPALNHKYLPLYDDESSDPIENYRSSEEDEPMAMDHRNSMGYMSSSDDPINEISSEEDGNKGTPASVRSVLQSGEVTGSSMVHPTTFDAYFAQASKSSKTSFNMFSTKTQRMSVKDYEQHIQSSYAIQRHKPAIDKLFVDHQVLFDRYILELHEGFNLIFFGYGSKRRLLNKFARDKCHRRGHVLILDGFSPKVGLKEMLEAFERIPGLTPLDTPSSNVDVRVQRVYDYFRSEDRRRRPLFLLIHNIDSPIMRAPKVRQALSLLALCPNIHLLASVDHINAPTLFSVSESSARKHPPPLSDDTEVPSTRGFAWLWHDLTTLDGYDVELKVLFPDPNVLVAPTAKVGITGGSGVGNAMTESAAQHILASVTQKGKRLFKLLASKQLEAAEGDENQDPKSHAMVYDALFSAARDDFIATSDTALWAILREFVDHSLILSASQTGAGESLWIPLKPTVLQEIVDGMDT